MKMKRRHFHMDSASEPVIYIDADVRDYAVDAADGEGKEQQRGLRTWTFDVRTRKRFYISATGKAYCGSEASRHFLIKMIVCKLVLAMNCCTS